MSDIDTLPPVSIPAPLQRDEVKPPSPEEALLSRFAQIGHNCQQFAAQIGAWVQSAAHCLELGDAEGFKKHMDIAEGLTANLAATSAAGVDWKAMLGRMRATGSKPAVGVMLANVNKGNGTINGATWWGDLDAAAAAGKGGDAGAARMVCVVIPVSHDTSKGMGPKLALA